ncbi:MAG: HAMP domain-containing histidine kinase [Tissierellia bacterium]|nr:HAMP domain-containing histidine kinase [Tissierellia bacterium]
MADGKRARSINTILFYYIFKIIISSAFIIFIMSIIINEGLKREIIYPANYVESMIIKNMDIYETKEKLEKEDIPPYTDYAVVDDNFNYKYGNISEDKFKEIKDLLEKDYTRDSYYGFLKVVNRDGEKLILNYSLKIRFKNPNIDKLFSYFERDVLIFTFILLIINILCLIIKFTREIGNSILSLKDISKEIENENLDFEIKYTNIKEVNQVVKSMDDMKNELKNSLERQWLNESEKREQISSLAHYLKTPLTIVKGNLQLLEELEEDVDKKEYLNYMDKNISDMEEYIKILINISKNSEENNYSKDYKDIDIKNLLYELLEKSKALALRKNIKINKDFENIVDRKIYANREEIMRIYENILSNAVDFSPVYGEINLDGKIEKDNFIFSVIDSGRGFSDESLKKATKEFYMDDISRGRKNHYGMGLFITKKLVDKYNGKINISNTKDGNGKVEIILPVK